MPAKGDQPAAAIADAFAVQGQTARQQPGVGLQPGCQGLGLGRRIDDKTVTAIENPTPPSTSPSRETPS